MYPFYYFTCKTQAVKCTKHKETVEFNEWIIVYLWNKVHILINWKDHSLLLPAFVKHFAWKETYDTHLAVQIIKLLIHPTILHASIFIMCQLLWFLGEEGAVLKSLKKSNTLYYILLIRNATDYFQNDIVNKTTYGLPCSQASPCCSWWYSLGFPRQKMLHKYQRKSTSTVSPTNKSPKACCVLSIVVYLLPLLFLLSLFKKSQVIQHTNYDYRFSDIFPLRWELNPNDYLPISVFNFYLLPLPLQLQMDIIWFLLSFKDDASAALYC